MNKYVVFDTRKFFILLRPWTTISHLFSQNFTEKFAKQSFEAQRNFNAPLETDILFPVHATRNRFEKTTIAAAEAGELNVCICITII